MRDNVKKGGFSGKQKINHDFVYFYLYFCFLRVFLFLKTTANCGKLGY